MAGSSLQNLLQKVFYKNNVTDRHKKKYFLENNQLHHIVFCRYIFKMYTHYLLQGTVYKGQLRQLVEFWKNIRDGLVFFPKVKGQDTIHQGTKD